MADSQLLKVWDDFSGGHYSTVYAHGIPEGRFVGTNMLVMADGTLAPRGSIAGVSVTSPDTGKPVSAWTNGTDSFYINTNGDLAKITGGFTPSWSLAAHGFVPTEQLGAMSTGSGTSYVGCSNTLGLFSINESTLAATSISASVLGCVLAFFKDRLYVAGNLTGTGYRVFYSAPANYSSFPAANFFDVPPATGRVAIMKVIGDQLYIGMQNSSPDVPRWYVLTDAPQNGGTLQALGPGPYPFDWRMVDHLLGEGVIYGGYNTGPVAFAGGNNHQLIKTVFGVESVFPGGQIVRSQDNRSMIVTDPNNSRFYHYDGTTNCWTRHTAPSGVNLAHDAGKLLVSRDDGWLFIRNTTLPLISGTQYEVGHIWNPLTSSTEIQPRSDVVLGVGSVPNGSVTLPEFLAPDGWAVRPRAIGVDAIALTTSDTDNTTLHMDASVFGFATTHISNNYPGLATTTATATLFDYAEPTGMGANARVNLVQNLGIQTDVRALRVSLTNIRGLVIERVYLYGTLVRPRWLG